MRQKEMVIKTCHTHQKNKHWATPNKVWVCLAISICYQLFMYACLFILHACLCDLVCVCKCIFIGTPYNKQQRCCVHNLGLSRLTGWRPGFSAAVSTQWTVSFTAMYASFKELWLGHGTALDKNYSPAFFFWCGMYYFLNTSILL